MGLKKGQCNNRNGKPVGTTNKLPRPIKERIAESLERAFADWDEIWEALKPYERVQAIKILGDYIIPKPSAESQKETSTAKTYTVTFE